MTARWQDLTEAEWQTEVETLLRIYGWEWLHVRKSLGKRGGATAWQTTTNISGWPDLFCWNREQDRRMAIELKAKYNKPSDDQIAVLTSLWEASIEAHVWWPKDLDEVVKCLAHQTATSPPERSGF